MRDILADGVAKDVQDDLADDEKEDAEGDVAEGPAVLQGIHDEDDLHDHIHEEADGAKDVEHDEQADGVGGAETSPALEGEQRDGARDEEHGEGGEAEEPDGEGSAIFVELETDKAVD